MDATLQFIPIMIVGFAASLGLTPITRQIAMNKLEAKDRHTAALKALRLGEILLEDLHDLIEDTAINPDD